jgi:hypothetical protein
VARISLPRWTAHPVFAVAVLFALAVLLIVHGEPQPSSRPSGRSVVVSGTAQAPLVTPAVIAIDDGVLQRRDKSGVRTIGLPGGAMPREVISNRGLTVVLALVDDRQHAFVLTKTLTFSDLGLADRVFPAVQGTAAMIVESAVFEPGRVLPTPSAGTRPDPTDTSTSSDLTQPELGDYVVRRYDSSGKPTGATESLPTGMRVGTDSRVGLVVWQPVSRVFEDGVASESLSAKAVLVRPDRTLRNIGALYPLAATANDLLVWNVATRQFGVLPLSYVTSTATNTAAPSTSASGKSSRSPTPTASPTTVVGARFYNPTRGFVVTGPASFAPDGSAFAVYAQVGNRRRLVIGELSAQLNDQIEVLALVKPEFKPSPSSGEASLSTSAADPSSASSAPIFSPDGFPIAAPVVPLWWTDMVVGIGTDGTIVGYRPGSGRAALVDLGITGASSVALAP